MENQAVLPALYCRWTEHRSIHKHQINQCISEEKWIARICVLSSILDMQQYCVTVPWISCCLPVTQSTRHNGHEMWILLRHFMLVRLAAYLCWWWDLSECWALQALFLFTLPAHLQPAVFQQETVLKQTHTWKLSVIIKIPRQQVP